MSSKAYRIPSAIDRLKKQQMQIKEIQGLQRSRNTPKPVASTAFAGVSAAGSEGGTGNFLATKGDTMIGPLALAPPVDFTVDIDADGILDIGESSSQSQYSSNIQIEDVPTSTTLDTIAGAAFDGQILVIRTFAPGSITIAQATLANGGNIQTLNDADFTMGNLQMISLIFDEALVVFNNAPGGTWRVLTGDGGGGGITFPIDFPEDDRGTVGASTQDILFSASTRHSVKMIITGDVALAFSSPPTDETAYTNIIIVQDSTGGHTLTLPVGTVNKEIVEAGFLTDADLETGIVIKFAFGIFYAFLETGNIVSGIGGDVAQWATFPAVDDVDVGTFDIKNIDRAIFVVDAGVPGVNSDIVIFAGTDSYMNYNVATNDGFRWRTNNLEKLRLDTSSADVILTLFGLDNETPIFQLFRFDSTPTVGSQVGRIEFLGVDSGGSTIEEFGRIFTEAEDLTIGAVDGSLHLGVTRANLPTTYLVLNNLNEDKIRAFRPLIMDTGRNIEMNGNNIFFDSGLNTKFSGTSTGITTTVNNVNMAIFNETALVLQPDVDLTTRGVLHTPVTTTFLADGFIWYSSALSLFQFRENGVTVSLSTAGSSISAGDSSVAVIDTGIGQVDVTLDSTSDYRFLSGSFSPLDVGKNLGNETFPWEKFSVKDLEIETGGTFTTFKNNIVSDGSGLRYNVPTGDFHTFLFNGLDPIQFRPDEIRFQIGQAHRIKASGTALQLLADNLTDAVEIFTGTSRSNSNIKIEDFRTTWFTDTTETAALAIQLVQNNDTPANFRTLANIDIIAENLSSVDTIYARISASSQVLTAGDEDGLLQLGVVSGGTLISGIDIEGSGNSGVNGAKIGFFGEATVVQQSVASDTLANLYTALRNLGLIV